MWALGDYPAVVTELISRWARCWWTRRLGSGQRVLDVAAGNGNVAIPAALAGASVIASDLTPELLEAGRRVAAGPARPWSGRWPTPRRCRIPTAAFDAVVSCVGAMFAPHHQLTADELVRVCRPGGTIGLISWTPAGFIGQMFAAMKPYAPPPPPGAQPPPLWGDESHVRRLFGDAVTDLRADARRLRVDHFTSPEAVPGLFQGQPTARPS